MDLIDKNLTIIFNSYQPTTFYKQILTRLIFQYAEQCAYTSSPFFMRVLTIAPLWNNAPFFREQVESLRCAGVETELFEVQTGRSILNYLGAWYRLRRSYNWKDFDLVHIHYGQTALIAFPCPLPVVITFHGSDLNGIIGEKGYEVSGKFLQFISRRAAQTAKKAIVVSQKMQTALKSDSVVIPCGINTEKFKPFPRNECRNRLNLPNKTLVLFAGDPQRTVKRFLLAQEAADKAEAQIVVACGVSHDQMPLYINACNAVLLTSYQEGSPQIVKEALACNVPVVSTDVGDVRERIVEGCFLGDDGDALAEGIKSVADRIDGAQVEELSLAKIAARIIEVYKAALKNENRN